MKRISLNMPILLIVLSCFVWWSDMQADAGSLESDVKIIRFDVYVFNSVIEISALTNTGKLTKTLPLVINNVSYELKGVEYRDNYVWLKLIPKFGTMDKMLKFPIKIIPDED